LTEKEETGAGVLLRMVYDTWKDCPPPTNPEGPERIVGSRSGKPQFVAKLQIGDHPPTCPQASTALMRHQYVVHVLRETVV